MRLKRWLNFGITALLFCLAGPAAFAQQQSSSQQPTGDPVADAARKAREAKKEAPKAKKVFTDDDLKPAQSEPPAQASGAAAAAGTDHPAGGAAKEENANGEAAWRKRFQNQRDKIARAEKELEVLQRETSKTDVQYYNDPQKAMMEQNTRNDINTLNAKIDAKQKEIEQLKQGLSDLEDQLRKAGGDPGWAR